MARTNLHKMKREIKLRGQVMGEGWRRSGGRGGRGHKACPVPNLLTYFI